MDFKPGFSTCIVEHPKTFSLIAHSVPPSSQSFSTSTHISLPCPRPSAGGQFPGLGARAPNSSTKVGQPHLSVFRTHHWPQFPHLCLQSRGTWRGHISSLIGNPQFGGVGCPPPYIPARRPGTSPLRSPPWQGAGGPLGRPGPRGGGEEEAGRAAVQPPPAGRAAFLGGRRSDVDPGAASAAGGARPGGFLNPPPRPGRHFPSSTAPPPEGERARGSAAKEPRVPPSPASQGARGVKSRAAPTRESRGAPTAPDSAHSAPTAPQPRPQPGPRPAGSAAPPAPPA